MSKFIKSTGKSLVEYWLALWGGIGATAAVAFDVVGILGTFSLTDWADVLPRSVWAFCLFAGFVLIPFIAFHKVRLQRDAMRRDRTDVVVEPQFGTDSARLLVRNTGTGGNFFARIEKVEGGDVSGPIIPCDAYWRAHSGRDIYLPTDGEAVLELAHNNGLTNRGDERVAIVKIMSPGSTFLVNTPLDSLISIEVEIAANPPLAVPFRQRYSLRVSAEGPFAAFEAAGEESKGGGSSPGKVGA